MVLRKIIDIDEQRCNGCGNCVVSCEEGAIEMHDGKAKVIKDSFCDGLGACMGNCPMYALHIIERDADEFDEKAVQDHLKNKTPASCASAMPVTMKIGNIGNAPTTSQRSFLSSWPIQMRLVFEGAPILQGRDLVLLADCVAVAYGNIQEDFVKDKLVLMGCPKFDDQQAYIDKLTGLLMAGTPSSITVVKMEVPCCGSIQRLVHTARENSGSDTPVNIVTILMNGQIS